MRSKPQKLDFANANIQGLDLSGQDLSGANFNNAQAGLSKFGKIGLWLVIFILGLLAGLVSGYSGAFISNLLFDQDANLFFGVAALIILLFCLAVTLLQGLGLTLVVIAEAIVAVLIAIMAIVPDASVHLATDAQFTVLAIASSMAGVINTSIATALARAIKLVFPRTLILIVVSIGISFGVLFGVREIWGYPIAAFVGVSSTTIGGYVGWWSMAGVRRYRVIRFLAQVLITKAATSFRGADLTAADFSNATLSNVDLRAATLTRTNWFMAKGLESARLENTYLENPRVQNLVRTKNGQNQQFDYLNLRGLHLEDANLEGASFIGADLSGSTLRRANLSGAKLAKTQLHEVDLTSACLTGAVIESWGISSNTRLDHINCDFIYTRLPTQDNLDPHRKPDNKNEQFRPGDFSDFVAPFLKTLDLYQTQYIDIRAIGRQFRTLDFFHHESIDPTAIAIAFQQLAAKNPEANLELLTLQGRSQERVRLQAKIAEGSDPDQLAAEYFENYNNVQSLTRNARQALLRSIEEKDSRIRSLEKLLENALAQPKYYVQTYTEGDYTMTENKGNINVSDVGGNVSGVAAAKDLAMTGVAMGEISGTVTNTINQLADALEPEKPGLKELLSQLQAAIEAEAELTDDDKVEALEQVKLLAEVGRQPQDNALQKAAKTSIKILRGTAASLPDAAQLVEACAELLPAIATLLALT
ncbi:MAG: low-complexity protein [Spirulina sp. SIO3F2]|nr:low-complexity protein [Spirulina sp. SIO3F2]